MTKDNRKVWSCKDCNWIHKKKVVDKIYNRIRAGRSTKGLSGGKKTEKTGVIIIGHGSRLRKANDTVRAIAAEIKKMSGIEAVASAYLQLCRPDLNRAVNRMVKTGCKKIVVVPFFLFMGSHVTRDIPKAIQKEAEARKDVKFVYAKNLSPDPRLANIVMDLVRKALQ